MILTGSEIQKQVKKGSITIEPFTENLLNPNSYNYRLGKTLRIVTNDIIDPRQEAVFTEVIIPEEGYILEPDKLYLGSTVEKIGSEEFVTSLIGRSSVGRLGMYLQITADLGQLGRAHCWTLEIRVVQPLRVYAGMRIGQVSFWKPAGDIDKLYTAGYTRFNTPHQNKAIVTGGKA
ncbi:MAG: deoxycytidine deaminase [Candidatus Saccharibacteria bacterium]|nr:deoxycytidine deaminase [Candidatus Saccharibacteria bacterium]